METHTSQPESSIRGTVTAQNLVESAKSLRQAADFHLSWPQNVWCMISQVFPVVAPGLVRNLPRPIKLRALHY